MADYRKDISTFTDYGAQSQDIERKRRMAELLQQQSMQPIETQPGVPISWTQGLAKLLQGYNAGQGMRTAAEEQKTLSAKRNQAMAAALGGMPAAQTTEMPGSQADTAQFDMAPQMQTTQPTMQDYTKWLGDLAQVGPDAISIGTGMIGMQQKAAEADENRDFRKTEAELARQSKRHDIEMRLASERMSEERAAELRRELKAMDDARARELAADRIAADERARRFMVANRQPVQPQIVQTEQGPMQVDRSGRAQPIVGPDGQPVKPKSTERALPTSAAQKLMENQQNLRMAQNALALISGTDPSGDKNATGLKGFIPDVILQRTDPQGVATRGAIANLGSLVIHDRSGAAVTAAEYPRLQPFIPSARDDPPTVRTKLNSFVREYQAIVDEAADFYRASGYRVPVETLRGASGAPRSGAGVPAGIDPAVWAVMTPEEKKLWQK